MLDGVDRDGAEGLDERACWRISVVDSTESSVKTSDQAMQRWSSISTPVFDNQQAHVVSSFPSSDDGPPKLPATVESCLTSFDTRLRLFGLPVRWRRWSAW